MKNESFGSHYAHETIHPWSILRVVCGDEDFKGVYQWLQWKKEKTYVDFYLQDGLLDKMGNLSVPREERVQLIREAHTSKIASHFGVWRVANLQRYVYWPKMQEGVASFLRGCILCCTRRSLVISSKHYKVHRLAPICADTTNHYKLVHGTCMYITLYMKMTSKGTQSKGVKDFYCEALTLDQHYEN
jgi:hypothetical protein